MAVTAVFWGFSSRRGLLIKASLGKSCRIGTLEGEDGFLKLKICPKNPPKVAGITESGVKPGIRAGAGGPTGARDVVCVLVGLWLCRAVFPKHCPGLPRLFPEPPLCSERWMPLARMRVLMLDHFGSDIFGDFWQYKSLLAAPAMTVLS